MYVLTVLMSVLRCIMNCPICGQYDAKSFMKAGLTSDPWVNPLRNQVHTKRIARIVRQYQTSRTASMVRKVPGSYIH